MSLLRSDQDVICALITPGGMGAISVIRVSGLGSSQVVRRSCRFLPAQPESHRIYYGFLQCPNRGDLVDEVLLSFFGVGQSFTGDETVEISCHGSPTIAEQVLRILVDSGARLAERGEFTFRAFRNGRIDLVQAESILGMIESRSAAAARASLRQLQGELSQQIARIEEKVLGIMADLEANIDFATEGLEARKRSDLVDELESVRGLVEGLCLSYDQGRIIVDGCRVTIVGRPNAGKSSLLNALLQEERSIVTHVAGTTRDVVTGELGWGGVRFNLADTAGLRGTSDLVESIGVERARAEMARSDLVLWVHDLADAVVEGDLQQLPPDLWQRCAFVGSKWDLNEGTTNSEWAAQLSLVAAGVGRTVDPARCFLFSARTGQGREALLTFLAGQARVEGDPDSAVLTQIRHFELLQRALQGLTEAGQRLRDDVGEELVVQPLQESLAAIRWVTGKAVDESVIDEIFARFCIGK